MLFYRVFQVLQDFQARMGYQELMAVKVSTAHMLFAYKSGNEYINNF